MFGRPWNLGPIRISAEIRWAVCHGYIAGKNGRKSWLSGLDVVIIGPNDTILPADDAINLIRRLMSNDPVLKRTFSRLSTGEGFRGTLHCEACLASLMRAISGGFGKNIQIEFAVCLSLKLTYESKVAWCRMWTRTSSAYPNDAAPCVPVY